MRALLGIGVLALTACTDPPKQPVVSQSTPDAKADAAPAKAPPPESPSGEDTPIEVEPAKDETAEAPTEEAAPPEALPELSDVAASAGSEVPSGDTPPEKPPTLAETKVEPTAVVRPWREVMSPTEPIAFLSTTSGVLGRGADGFYDVDDNGALVARAEIESPPGDAVLGHWPDNAWSIQRIVKEESDGRAMDIERFFRLMRLRGNRRWVPQVYNGEQRVEDDGEDFFIGGKGGILVVNDGITRVAGRADDPADYDTSGEIIGAFESARGALFTANLVPSEEAGSESAVFLSRGCAADDADCDPVRSQLPHGSYWEFSTPVPRAKYSISTLASTSTGGGVRSGKYLVSFGGDAWKLEELAAKPEGMWPAKDGGLWMLVREALLHRSGAGVWESVALPEGLGSVSAAMRKDKSELWVSGVREGKPLIYAIAATPELPPAAE